MSHICDVVNLIVILIKKVLTLCFRIFSLTRSVILLAGVGNIDTSGISMLEEVKKITERRELQVILSFVLSANYFFYKQRNYIYLYYYKWYKGYHPFTQMWFQRSKLNLTAPHNWPALTL